MTLSMLYEEQTQTVVPAWMVYRLVYGGCSIKKESVSVRSLKHRSKVMG